MFIGQRIEELATVSELRGEIGRIQNSLILLDHVNASMDSINELILHKITEGL